MRRLKEEDKLNEAQSLFFSPSKPKEELYNLIADPAELHNLAETSYKSQLAAMRAKLPDTTRRTSL